jgi:hypothetical protein
MPRRPAGQPLTLSTTVTQLVAGVATLTDPGAITLQLRNPDLTITTYTTGTSPAVVRDSLGTFHIDLPNTLVAGPYQWAWVTTGTAAGRREGGFNLDAAFSPSHVDFADARARLNTSSLTDDEISDMIASAVSEQERKVGAVAPRTVTELVPVRYGRLALSTRPVLSVTSAMLNGVGQTITSWTVPSAMAGLVELGTGPYWGGSYGTLSSQLYSVTFVAGRNPVPQDLVEAALLRVQASYETQRGPAGLPLADQQDSGFGSSYPLLLRAEAKERPYVLPSVA